MYIWLHWHPKLISRSDFMYEQERECTDSMSSFIYSNCTPMMNLDLTTQPLLYPETPLGLDHCSLVLLQTTSHVWIVSNKIFMLVMLNSCSVMCRKSVRALCNFYNFIICQTHQTCYSRPCVWDRLVIPVIHDWPTEHSFFFNTYILFSCLAESLWW